MSQRGARLLRTVVILAAITAVAVAFALHGRSRAGSGTPARLAAGPSARPSGARAASPPPAARTPRTLVARRAAWSLANPLSSEVVLPDGGSLLLAGGLTASDTSANGVFRVNPLTGALTPFATLAAATHDAAGAVLGGAAYVFGGGTSVTFADVQRVPAGGGAAGLVAQLPRPRSDLAAAAGPGGTAYLVGGYDGNTLDPTVLATRDGVHFAAVGRLPVPVRYPAVAVVGRQLFVVGGMDAGGSAVDYVQVVNLAGGAARVAGHLPGGLAHATGLVLGGQVYVAGGVSASGARSGYVYRISVGGTGASVAATLPVPVSDAGGAVLGGVGYLVGGYTGPLRPTTAVQTLRLG